MSSKHFDKTKQILFHRILKMGVGVGHGHQPESTETVRGWACN